MMIIGITGKSGSGKSTVARKLAEKFDAYYLDIDRVMHEAIEENFDFVVETFGPSVIVDGEINRKLVGDLIFSNRHKYAEYNQKIYESGKWKIIQGIAFYKDKVTILDHILLPHMTELWDRCTTKVLVQADADIRRLRILARDNISEEYLAKREAASIEYDTADFDFIIENNLGNGTYEVTF